jgi:SAM-dependent methyltransferase
MSVAAAAVAAPALLRSDAGPPLPLHVDRWFGEPSGAERDVLDRALAPVLDVGCGPARHTLTLLRRGVRALGVDASAAAVRLARGRGAPVLHRSVFDALPDEGGWGTALLLDGNVGIGGDPSALMARLRRLLRPGGRALVEVDPPGTPTESFRARLTGADPASWFPWARVGADRLGDLGAGAGLRLAELWPAEGRWFGRLDA